MRHRLSSLSKRLSTGGDRLLLVTAHPDDETLFFAPLLLALKMAIAPSSSGEGAATYPAVRVLCLSTGNFYGQGERRRGELLNACSRHFGLDEGSVCALDEEGLQDGFDKAWAPDTVAALVLEHARDVDVIVTFDEYGVSGHPNHRATYHGVRRALEMRRQQSSARALLGLKLHSTNALRKFSGALDVLYSLFLEGRLRGGYDDERFFVLNYNVLIVLLALLDHRSQLQWYRVAFVLLSRYSYINTYSQIV